MRLIPLSVLLLATAAAGCQNPISGVVTYGNRYRELGIERYNDAEYLQAEGAFDEAVEQNPTDFRNHYWLAESQLQLNQPDNALQSLKTALRVRRLTEQGREDLDTRNKVADALGRAIAASPNGSAELQDLQRAAAESANADLYSAVAATPRERGDADNAIHAYEQAVMLAPEDPTFAREYGLYLLDLEQPQIARPVLIRAYDNDPEDAEVQQALTSIGVVPGPSLRPRSRLSKPPLPKGPIPEFKLDARFDDNRKKPVNLDEVRQRYEEQE